MKHTRRYLRSKRYLTKIDARETRKILLGAVRIWEARNFEEALAIASSYREPRELKG
jgi:hypothetical protein